jgi:hypothetical protein
MLAVREKNRKVLSGIFEISKFFHLKSGNNEIRDMN